MARPPLLLLAALALGPTLGPTPAHAEASPLAARIDALVNRLAPPESHVGVCVQRLGEAEPFYMHEATKLFTPASLQKLTTASAALTLLGPQRRFTTRLLTDAEAVGGALRGNLYLRGEGDPLLDVADLEELAKRLRAQGVRQVAGDLVADASYFQPEGRGAPGWAWDDLAQGYGAPVSALALHHNAVDVEVGPGARAGDPLRIALTPTSSYLRIANRAMTQPTGENAALSLGLVPAPGGAWQEVVEASGGLPQGAGTETEHLSVAEPVHFTATLMREALTHAGISVDGQARGGVTPGSARTVAQHASPMLADIVHEMLKESDNLTAETVLMHLGIRGKGAPGTWEKGLATLRGFLERVGWDPEGYRLSDGSGLSRYNALTPAMLARLLNVMPTQHGAYPALLVGLPIAGVDGTLAKRLEAPPTRGRLRAKTGTMSGVSGLAGYLDTADGESLVVVVMSNGFIGSAARSRQLQDALIELLAAPGS